MIGAADERPHRPPGEIDWVERWWFRADGDPGPIELAVVRPHPPHPWGYRLVLDGPRWGPTGSALVLVADPEVPPPAAGRLELRAPGLWADHVCEEPMRRWSIGLEAFGVALDDRDDADRADPYGRRCAVGLDLEWEHTADIAVDAGPMTGYRARCRVGGEVLVDDAVVDVEVGGERGHCWGRAT